MFGLPSQFLAHSSPKPCNFLNVGSEKGVFYYVNEVTFRKAGGANSVIRGLEFLVPSSSLEGGERGLRLNQSPRATSINHIVKPP